MIQRIALCLRKVGDPNNEKGFTLVELLVTLILVVLFFSGVIGLVTQGFNLFAYDRNFARLNREGNKILDRVEALIRGCKRINDGEMGSKYSRYMDLYAEIDGDDETTGNWEWDSELGRNVNIGEQVTIFRDSDSSPNLEVKLRYMKEVDDLYELEDLQTVITGLLDTSDADALQFTYYRYDETGSQLELVTSGFNERVDVVRVSVKLTISTGGKTDSETFSRHIKLRIDR